METTRLEAFSDGVFAVAITLLALDLRPAAGRTLAEQLTSHDALARYAAYTVSFLVVGIIWVNHHEVFRHLARADRVLLFLNLLLLLFVAAIPFPTAVLAEHLGGRADAHSAALAYSMVMLLMGVSFGRCAAGVCCTAASTRPRHAPRCAASPSATSPTCCCSGWRW